MWENDDEKNGTNKTCNLNKDELLTVVAIGTNRYVCVLTMCGEQLGYVDRDVLEVLT